MSTEQIKKVEEAALNDYVWVSEGLWELPDMTELLEAELREALMSFYQAGYVTGFSGERTRTLFSAKDKLIRWEGDDS